MTINLREIPESLLIEALLFGNSKVITSNSSLILNKTVDFLLRTNIFDEPLVITSSFSDHMIFRLLLPYRLSTEPDQKMTCIMTWLVTFLLSLLFLFFSLYSAFHLDIYVKYLFT